MFIVFLWSVSLWSSSNLDNFQSLVLQISFTIPSHTSHLLWDSNFMYIRLIIVPEVTDAVVFFFLFSLYSPHFILSSLIFSSAHLLLIPPSVFFILDVFFITRSLILAIEKYINLSCFSLCYAFFCFNMRSISIIAMLISLITDSVIVVIFASVAPSPLYSW